MTNTVYKQVPQINSNNKTCPFCRSHIGFTKIQKAYAYTRDYQNRVICSLKLYYCYNCRIAYYFDRSSFMIDELGKKAYRICFFDPREYDKRSIQKKINIFPTEIIAPEADTKSDIGFYSDRIRELTPDIIKTYEAPSETIGIFLYEMPEHPMKNLRIAYIVRGKSVMRDKRIIAYGINHEYSDIMQNALINETEEFTYQGIARKLHYCFIGEELKNHMSAMLRIKKIEEASFDHPVDIFVYKGKGAHCKKNHYLEMVTANIISARSDTKQSLSVYYCSFCDEYFVNNIALFSFCRLNGLPPFKLHYLKSSFGEVYESRYDSFSEFSDLRLYGYYVSGDMENQSEYRKRLLEDIVDSGLMTKADILQHLEILMRTRMHQPGAVERWKSDYDHLYYYREDRQRIVWGRLTTK